MDHTQMWFALTSVLPTLIFFSFLALCVVASAWKRRKIEALRHETARLLIEKNPEAAVGALGSLLNPTPPAAKPGSAWRIACLAGTVVVAAGVGLALMGFVLRVTGSVAGQKTLNILAPASLVVVVGAGILVAAYLFLPRPPADKGAGGAGAEGADGAGSAPVEMKSLGSGREP